MEPDPNIFAEVDLRPIHFPERLCRVGRAISHFVLGPHLLSPISDHHFENTGGGPALDRAMLEGPNQMVVPEEIE